MSQCLCGVCSSPIFPATPIFHPLPFIFFASKQEAVSPTLAQIKCNNTRAKTKTNRKKKVKIKGSPGREVFYV